MVCTVDTILRSDSINCHVTPVDGKEEGFSYHVHQDICQHACADLVVAPSLL